MRIKNKSRRKVIGKNLGSKKRSRTVEKKKTKADEKYDYHAKKVVTCIQREKKRNQ